MNSFSRKLEGGFQRWGAIATGNPIKTILAILVFTLLLASNLKQVQLDMSTEGLFRSDDPQLIEYEAFQDQFGRDERIVLAVLSPKLFTEPFLEKLVNFHQALEERVPNLVNIDSLVNARSTVGTEDALLVTDLMEAFIEGNESPESLKKRIMSNRQYKNRLVSEDGQFVTLLLQMSNFSSGDSTEEEDEFSEDMEIGSSEDTPAVPLSDNEQIELLNVVREVVKEFEGPKFVVHLAGSPVVTDMIRKSMKKDMIKLTAIAVVIIGILLAILFRRASGVFIPITIVLLSLVGTLALYPTTSSVVTTTVIILPSFLLATGVAAAVHILSIFYQSYDGGMKKNEAVIHALAHSGLPVFMTSITTAVGLWSFLTAELRSIADLGLFAGLGILLILVNTLVLLPAMVSLSPIRTRKPSSNDQGFFLDRSLVNTGDYAVTHPWKILSVTMLLLVISFVGISKLVVSHNQLSWFPEKEPVKVATELIDEKMKGSVSMEILVKAKKDNAIKDSELLKKIGSFQEFLKQLKADDGSIPVGTTLSIVDIIKEIHQALNENDEAFYDIPDDNILLAQEILLFENSGSEDLEEVTNSAFTLARITVKVPWKDASFYVNFVKKIQNEAESIFGNEVEVTTTGLLLLFTTAISAIIQSMISSYLLAGILITIMMILLLTGIKKGLISMIPNLTPIILAMGIMGWFEIKMDMFTLLIGSIAIGLAVDDTIHFMHKFYDYYSQKADVKEAVRKTLSTTGRAMLFTSIALVSGFWIFLTATLSNVYYFGLFTGVTVFLAFLSDILLSPALMSVIHSKRQ